MEDPRRRWSVLAVCCLSLLIVSLDVSIVNVALPSIRRDFTATVSGLQWTVDAYTLVMAALLMLSGSLGDRFGRRRVFQLGLVLFTLGSLMCSLAPSLGWLVVFRMVQAAGGSMLNPVAMSIIVNTFTDPKERARAIGFWGAVVGVSLALGPVVGGVLVTSAGWRSIFWINLPIGIVAIILAQRFVPESRAARARRFDPAAQILVAVFLGSMTYAIIAAPHQGVSSPLIVALAVLGLAAGTALVGVELRRREPLLDPRFFRSAPFSGATIAATASFAALGGFLFVNALYLQDARGFSPLHAGIFTLPMAAMTAVFAPISGRLVAGWGARVPLVSAGAAITLGAVLLIWLTPHTPAGLLLTSYALVGLGFGMVNAPVSNTAVTGMPRAQAGVAAAIASTSRQVGSALGVAVTGSLVATTTDTATAFTTASHPAWLVIHHSGPHHRGRRIRLYQPMGHRYDRADARPAHGSQGGHQ